MNLHSRLVLVVLWVLCVAPAVFSSTEIYVATHGDDNNDGSIAQPFASIERAQQAVRALIAEGLTDDVVVYIRGGVYPFYETLGFTSADSGTSDYTIIWKAYQGETVRFVRGVELDSLDLELVNSTNAGPQVALTADDGQAQDPETITITVVNLNRTPVLTLQIRRKK